MATKTLNFATLTAANPYVIGGAPDNLVGYTHPSGSSSFTIGLLSGVNQFYGNSSSSNSVFRDDTILSGAQYSAQVTIGTTNGSGCGPALLDSSNNGYVALSSDGTGNTRLFKVVASQLGAQVGSSVTNAHTDNQVRELRWTTGGVMSMWVNGVQIGVNITDTTYTPTYAAAISRAGRLRNMASIYTPAQSVTSINGGSPITSSQSTVAAITTGFTGLPATITTNVTGVTCGTISGTTNAPTWVQTVRTDGAVFPKDGTVVTYTFTNGSETASGTQTINKDADQTKVVVASPINDDTTCLFGAIFAATGRSAANNDEVYHTVPVGMSDLVVNPDGTMEVTNAGTFDCWVWTNATGVNYFYQVTITENGEVIVPPTPSPSSGSGRIIRSAIGRQIWPIVPHSTNPVGGASSTKRAYGIKVSGGGTVVMRTEGGTEDVTITLASGATLPVVVTHIRDTSTATGILGYSVY